MPVQSITQSAIDFTLAEVLFIVPVDCSHGAVQFYKPISGPLLKLDQSLIVVNLYCSLVNVNLF